MRGSHSNVATEADEIALCMQLKREGLTVREIAERTGLSSSTVQRRITAGVAATIAPGVEELRASETVRLARLTAALAPAVAVGDVKAVGESRRISESLRRLHGADAPTVSEIHLDARIDVEVSETVAAVEAVVRAVIEALELDAGYAQQIHRYAMETAGHHFAPPGTPPPAAPVRRLALMPGSGSGGPSGGLPDDPGPMVPTEGLTAAEQAELAALLGSMEDDDAA